MLLRIGLYMLTAALIACSSLVAGDLETQLGFMKSKYLAGELTAVFLKQDYAGYVHAVYLNPRTPNQPSTIGYSKFDSDGNRLFPDVAYRGQGHVGGIDGAHCRGGVSLLLYASLHLEMGYAVIDTEGVVIDTGHFAAQWSNPRSFRAPDGNAILVGSNPATNFDKTYNLPVLWERGDAKLYAFSMHFGRAVGALGFHMLGDSSIYIFTHLASPDDERYWFSSADENLAVFNYNTWLGHIVDSTIISLPDNSDLIASDIPFEGIRIRNDQDGNMLVFASYIDRQSKQHLRIFTLTPDLKILSPPKLQIMSELANIDLPKGSNPIRLFWYEHDRWGVPLRFHEIAVVGDTLYHSKLFDTGMRSYE